MKNKLIVFGASGFIGQNLLNILTLNNVKYDIVVRNLNNVKKYNLPADTNVYQCDLDNISTLYKLENIFKNNNYEECIDLAWYCNDNYQTSIINFNWIWITLTIAKLFAKYNGKKFLFAGSVFEYEQSINQLDEYNSPLTSNLYYGIAKHQCYSILSDFFSRSNIQYKHARIFNLFGQYEKITRLIPYIIQQAKQKQNIELNENYQCDYSYVIDTCNALYTFLKSDIIGAINICSGQKIAIKDIATLICNKLNCPIDKICFKSLNSNKCVYGNNDKLKNDVKYIYQYSIDNAIDEVL